jgi:hypothetical protein
MSRCMYVCMCVFRGVTCVLGTGGTQISFPLPLLVLMAEDVDVVTLFLASEDGF